MMNTRKILLIIVVILNVVSCSSIDTTTDGKIKKMFKEWTKDNLHTKASIESVSYDTVGCPMDFMFNATMLSQTVGSSGHSESEINIGAGLIGLDCILDSTLLTTDIIIAKIKATIKDSLCIYYIGMRGDSICTSPQEYGYEALIKTHTKGEQRLYDACYEIYCNLNDYAINKTGTRMGRNISKEDYYYFWKSLPSFEESMEQAGYNSVLNSKY